MKVSVPCVPLDRYNKPFQSVALVNEYCYQEGMTLGEACLLL